ncbi:unnamed protein product [Adineta ricciae]|uniref:Uncharacterized protein n=1 Tax=Adineta ricciae TaxID=249248 RepID=A0A813Y137_ADIRI|nr:unnamed protein product [Adineta ricciae]
MFVRRYTIVLLLIVLFATLHLPTNRSKILNEQESSNCSQLCPYVMSLSHDYLHFDSHHLTRHYPDFVCQLNFRNMADWVYGWPYGSHERIETTRNGKHIAPCLPDGSIIYVSIWAIGTFFTDVYPHLFHRFVLITGEGDSSSPILDYLERADSKIIHWFGQNGAIASSTSKKFTHIPIGLQCYEMAEAMKTIYKEQSNYTLPQLYGDIDEPINKTSGVNPSNLIDVYRRNREHSFWLSPRGNGLDCHRTWEALYLDMIPIVWNSSLNVLYENLPVVVIHDYKEITEEFLNEKLKKISTTKFYLMKQTYRMEKLRNAYWRRLILSKSRHSIKEINKRTNVCWRVANSTKSSVFPWQK